MLTSPARLVRLPVLLPVLLLVLLVLLAICKFSCWHWLYCCWYCQYCCGYCRACCCVLVLISAAWLPGGKIKSFLSFCGGLPCPDDNTNPFGYKFSWSPRGVLLAAIRKAVYWEDGVQKELDGSPGNGIYEKFKLDTTVPNAGTPLKGPWPSGFESHSNGDSVKFRSIYGIESADALIRGTFRNVGWCSAMCAIKDLGLLDETACEAELAGKTFAQVLAKSLGCEPAPAAVKAAAGAKVGQPVDGDVMSALDWLGLFSDKDASAPTLLDAVAKLFLENPKFWYVEENMPRAGCE